jgi:hypothetical protein
MESKGVSRKDAKDAKKNLQVLNESKKAAGFDVLRVLRDFAVNILSLVR